MLRRVVAIRGGMVGGVCRLCRVVNRRDVANAIEAEAIEAIEREARNELVGRGEGEGEGGDLTRSSCR